jgi:peroxiredoxin
MLLVLLVLSPIQAAEKAPDFTVPGSQGEVRLADYRGRVVYLDFWASWCAPCRKSFPWMDEMQARYGERGLKIIAISLDRERAAAKELLRELGAQVTIGFDPTGEVAAAYKVRAMPSSYLIDRNGNIHKVHLGFFTALKQDYETEIQVLLAQ